ncbi:MAG: Unknown protein [uncultured Thiotrichaceae bacterium]|uniref:DUF8082 domain-containing protein n=1 Tax=uncultured Thiotrichaceae bacterium TaxID=298394 RepID=A0A6S6T081_9GAMM|nr:MAG: Unknown protein [uncultured Thiotrichaceae bacterium]
MEQIVQNLSSLKGVLDACLYKDTEIVASTFSEEQNVKMSDLGEMVDQVFGALRAIEKSHDEIYFSLNDKYIAVYFLNDSHLAILLTEKKINFPLVHMGVKSAAGKLKRIQEKAEKEQQQLSQSVNGHVASTPAHIPTEESIKTQLIRISTVLMGYLGPAAMLIVDDHVEVWKQKYVQTPENLEYLVIMLESEITSDTDKVQFRDKVSSVIAE